MIILGDELSVACVTPVSREAAVTQAKLSGT